MYKDYAILYTNCLARFGGFGGFQGDADFAGAFSLCVYRSSDYACPNFGSRLIKFGD